MPARPWRLLYTGRRSGAFNMAVDAAVLRAVESGDAPPTLRIYGWDPWCVSLGHFQTPEHELDLAALKTRGWDFVMRPTGGRAVLHAEEITYSLLARRDEAHWCTTLGLAYDRIGAAWAEVLQGFGLCMVRGAGVPTSARATHGSPLQGQPAPPCFVSTSRAELAFAGRKVIGSAQRRTREAFVQHGSIPVTPAHECLVEVLRLDAERREAWLRLLRRHAVSLGEIGTVPADLFGSWDRELGGRLMRALDVEGEEGELTAGEAAFAAAREGEHRENYELRITKYELGKAGA